MSRETRRGSRSAPWLGAVVALTLAPALPAPASDLFARDVVVAFADLDIDTVEGAGRLLGRIEGAAARVCAPLDHGDLASRARERACRQRLTEAAVARVDNPVLASVHASARRAMPSLANARR